ncbi:unnamed protein product [Phytophthora fragariaefolia]|uniref:Unnamed protein product n=1 Tax=Phytophthora fragariaefolia TaxID=1490495 RepID=A0A9W6YHK2_9STRA|nr:unnamed protein product [Phytophthora fragariaefolia]
MDFNAIQHVLDATDDSMDPEFAVRRTVGWGQDFGCTRVTLGQHSSLPPKRDVIKQHSGNKAMQSRYM